MLARPVVVHGMTVSGWCSKTSDARLSMEVGVRTNIKNDVFGSLAVFLPPKKPFTMVR